MKYPSEEWEGLANSIARSYCPNIYPCKKCNYPVISGHCCNGCGDSSPSTTKKQDDEFNKTFNN